VLLDLRPVAAAAPAPAAKVPEPWAPAEDPPRRRSCPAPVAEAAPAEPLRRRSAPAERPRAGSAPAPLAPAPLVAAPIVLAPTRAPPPPPPPPRADAAAGRPPRPPKRGSVLLDLRREPTPPGPPLVLERWACGACGLSNEALALSCSACDAPRRREAPDDGWACRACGAGNAGGALSCGGCGNMRPYTSFRPPKADAAALAVANLTLRASSADKT
jgi:hypothetical protein